uniref:Uncharacterized protein n=1 Tax=Biomphalaria glabrata TaxID=6526 RepID=A0A2C9LBH2_BIOGL
MNLLFGSCQSVLTSAVNGHRKFRLETQQIEKLEKEIKYLIGVGFTWKDAYTQCTLQNILVHFRHGRTFNHRLCQDALGVGSPDWSEEINNDIANVLVQLLESEKDGIDDLAEQAETSREIDLFNSNKRDEIVQVHKYFDKSTGQLKRDPFRLDRDAYTFTDRDDNSDASFDQGQSLDDNFNSLLTYGSQDDAQQDREDTDSSSLLQKLWGYSNEESSEDSVSAILDKLQVPSEDQLILQQLLADKVQPSDLSSEQQRRLQNIVSGLIGVLENKINNRYQKQDDLPERQPPEELHDEAPKEKPNGSSLNDLAKALALKSTGGSQNEDKTELFLDKKTVDGAAINKQLE